MEVDQLTLAPAWRAWIAENLLLGVSGESLLAELAQAGVPVGEARARIAEIGASPILAAGRAFATEAERLSHVMAMRRMAERLAPEPTTVERVEGLDADDFYTRYVATGTPVVLTAVMRGWPAVGKWTPSYLGERFGDVEIVMTADRESDPLYDAHTARHSRPIRMGDYARMVEEACDGTNDFYLVAQNRNLERSGLTPLFDDLAWPEGFLDPTLRDGCSALWFGPAGTITPLHHDTCNILFCQVYGEKRIELVSPMEERLFDRALSMYATVELDALDDTLVKVVHLGPGDAMFIPVGWWHRVTALTPSISLAFSNLARDADFDWYRPGDVQPWSVG